MTAPEKPELSNEELKPCGECGHRHYYTDVCGSILNPTENAVYFRHCECDGDPKSLGKPFRRAQEAPQGERELVSDFKVREGGDGALEVIGSFHGQYCLTFEDKETAEAVCRFVNELVTHYRTRTERDRKIFEAGYEAFTTKHYTLDQAWEAYCADKAEADLSPEVQAALSGGGDERWEKEAPVAPVRKWEAEDAK